jgi:hypothetical protein
MSGRHRGQAQRPAVTALWAGRYTAGVILIVAFPLGLIALAVGLIMFATPLEAVALMSFVIMARAIWLLVGVRRWSSSRWSSSRWSSSRWLAVGTVLTAIAAVVNIAASTRHWPDAVVLVGYGVLALGLACAGVSLVIDARSGRLSEWLPTWLTRFAQARTR